MSYLFDGDVTGGHQVLTKAVPVTAVPLTMAVWFKPTVAPTAAGHEQRLMTICADTQSSTFNNGFSLWIQSATGEIRAGVEAANVQGNSVWGSGETRVDEWIHVAGVFASSTSRQLFVDGSAATEHTVNLTPANIDYFGIGSDYRGEAGVGPFAVECEGYIAHAAIWNVALTADEIALLSEGVAPDRIRPASLIFYEPLTDGPGSLTNDGAVLTTEEPPPPVQRFAPSGWSVSNYLQRTAAVVSPSDYPFVVSLWTNDTAFGDTALSIGVNGSSAQGFRFCSGGVYNASGTRARWLQSGNQANAQARSILSSSPSVPSGEWVHFCYEMISASEIHASMNGANRLSNTTDVVTQQLTPDTTRIGLNENSANPWGVDGAIAELAFFSAAGMTEANRLALRDLLYAGANPLALNEQVGQPWTGKLVAYVDLDIASATFGQDLSGNGHHFTEVGSLSAFASYPPVSSGFPLGWSWRAAVTISAAQVPSAQSDFPVLLTAGSLPLAMFDADGAAPAQNGGGDIRVTTDAAGFYRVPIEVVSFVTDNDPANGSAELWAKVPSLSGTVDTVLYVWWGTPAAESQPPVDDAYGRNAVWSDYLAVLHLNDTNYTDSTGNGYDGTATGTLSAVSTGHPWGGSWLDFGSGVNYLTLPTGAALSNAELTAQAWYALNTVQVTGEQGLVSNRRSTQANNWFQLSSHRASVTPPPNERVLAAFDGGSGEVAATRDLTRDTATHRDALTLNASVIKHHRDDLSPISGASGGTFSTSLDVTVGSYYSLDATYSTDARIGEVRLRLEALSDDWLATEYSNQGDPAIFASVSTQPVDLSLVGTTGAGRAAVTSTTVTVDAGTNRLFLFGIGQNRNPINLAEPVTLNGVAASGSFGGVKDDGSGSATALFYWLEADLPAAGDYTLQWSGAATSNTWQWANIKGHGNTVAGSVGYDNGQGVFATTHTNTVSPYTPGALAVMSGYHSISGEALTGFQINDRLSTGANSTPIILRTDGGVLTYGFDVVQDPSYVFGQFAPAGGVVISFVPDPMTVGATGLVIVGTGFGA